MYSKIGISMDLRNKLETYFDLLWPLNRSLTGNGNRKTLEILSEIIPFNIVEVPSGTVCYDWTVPPEWNVKTAWIKDSRGNIHIDFSKNNLHLMGYSIPFKGRISYNELKEHLYFLEDQPDAIPYRTSYYSRRWGFCLSYNQFLELDSTEEFEVFIDSTLNSNGAMTVAEAVIEGKSSKEFVFSSYICHPSMANNELSGPLVLCFLYDLIKRNISAPQYTYRFLLMPETIGSIWYISQHYNALKQNVLGGMILTCIGDKKSYTLKKSREANNILEEVAEHIVNRSYEGAKILEFFPIGSDERQYCSPGVNLPFCSLMRSMYGTFKEYHTSLDDKHYISFDSIQQSISDLYDVVRILENNVRYQNLFPMCEPQLGKRGLYPTVSAPNARTSVIDAIMWILNYSDGHYSLFDILKKSGLALDDILQARDLLLKNGIITLYEY